MDNTTCTPATIMACAVYFSMFSPRQLGVVMTSSGESSTWTATIQLPFMWWMFQLPGHDNLQQLEQ